jgi:hypothetical protein
MGDDLRRHDVGHALRYPERMVLVMQGEALQRDGFSQYCLNIVQMGQE